MRLKLLIISSALIVLAFPLMFWICELSYDINLESEKWWMLRMNLYASFIFLCFLLLKNLSENKILKFIFDIGLGLSVSDIVDRLWFKVYEFRTNDVIAILLTILFAIVDYNKKEIHSYFLKYVRNYRNKR